MALTEATFVVRECKFPFPSLALKRWAQLSGGLWQQLSFAHLLISQMGQCVRSPLVRRRAAESTGNSTHGTRQWAERRRCSVVNNTDSVQMKSSADHLRTMAVLVQMSGHCNLSFYFLQFIWFHSAPPIQAWYKYRAVPHHSWSELMVVDFQYCYVIVHTQSWCGMYTHE